MLLAFLGTDLSQVCCNEVSWVVRSAVGTSTDTPETLKLKAAEFLRLAAYAHTPLVQQDLRRFASLYLEAARKLEAVAKNKTASELPSREPS